MNITKNFTFEEFERSEKARENGIINVITTFAVRDAIVALCRNVLQPLRDLYGKPMNINSGYRCRKLNELVDGAESSQHRKGEAADVRTGSRTASYRMAKLVVENDLPFDQMILYPTFIHISHKKDGKQRREILYNKSYNGKRF